MILEYIWIDSFRVLEKVGLNFSAERIYHYDINSRKLTFSKNDNYINNFFGSNIPEVTALIGENGVGKSTIFEFLIRNIANFNNGGGTFYQDGDFFAVFSNFILVKTPDLISNKKELEEFGYKIVKHDAGSFGELIGTGYEYTTYIYYSNVFDYRIEYERGNNLIDISTNHLLIEDSLDSDGIMQLYMFPNSELKRQIDCLAEVDFNPPFVLPEKLYIRISEKVYQYKHLITFDELKGKGLSNIADLELDPAFNSPHEKVKIIFYQNLLKYRSYLNTGLYKDIAISTLKTLFSNEFSDFTLLTDNQKQEFSLIKTVFDNYQSLIVSEKIAAKESENSIYVQYFIKKDNSLFYKFLNSLNSLMDRNTFIHFSWDGISAGEKAFLSIVSRLNYAKNLLLKNEDREIKNVFLLIDEFDLYMHPEWQRTFFNAIYNNLPKIFKNIQIQIILSTHSPFVASDLPNSNIVFLKKESIIQEESEEKFICKIEHDFNNKTFGANIYQLLCNSFFMENGFVGEFAKNKIMNLLQELNKVSELNNEQVNDYMKKIEIIGEPVISEKLKELLMQKQIKPSIEEIIAQKKKEIEDLESQIRKGDA